MRTMHNFSVFILTNGRADNVITYKTLKNSDYTGNIRLLVDDEDKQLEKYKKNYKDEVIVFNKQEAIDMTDSMDNFKKRNSVVYARNIVYKKAKEKGFKYILVLDDDYSFFGNCFNSKREYITSGTTIRKLDRYIKAMLDFFINSKLDCLAMAQGGDFIGGSSSGVAKKYLNNQYSRKAMNAFFFDVDNPLYFKGRINEDVNMYIKEGSTGKKILTFGRIRLEQKQTQSNQGGLTDIYLDLGTFVKSFYSIMINPSCVKLTKMGVVSPRIHHKIIWRNAVPQIIDERYKKR